MSARARVTSIVPSSQNSSSERQTLLVRTDKGAIPIAAAALHPCFANDPVLNWCLRRPDGTTLNHDLVFMQRLWNVFMALSYGGDASFVTIDGEWTCTGILFPPQKKPGGLRGYLTCWKDLLWCLWRAEWRTSMYLLFEHDRQWISQFQDAAFPRQREVMEKGDYYYIWFLGTREEARGRGFGSAFVKYAQQVASKDGKPIYLEASSSQNKALYLRHGFEVVKELTMGKGEVGKDGRVLTNSEQPREGVTWWAMTWWPKED